MFVQGLGPYSTSIKKVEKEIKEMAKKVNDLCGLMLESSLAYIVMPRTYIALNLDYA